MKVITIPKERSIIDYDVKEDCFHWSVRIVKRGKTLYARIPTDMKEIGSLEDNDIVRLIWGGVVKKGIPSKRAKIRPAIPYKLRYNILIRDNFKCKLCGRSAEDNAKLEIDHIIPVIEGGSDDDINLQTLCYECHKGKTIIERKKGD